MSFPRHLILIISCLSIAKYSFAQQDIASFGDMAQCPIPTYPQLTD